MHSYFKNDTIWAADLYGIYNSSPSARFVNPIQIGRPYCIYYLRGLYHELRGYSVITHLALKIRSSVKKPS